MTDVENPALAAKVRFPPFVSKCVQCSIGHYGLKAPIRCTLHQGLLSGTKPPFIAQIAFTESERD